MHDVEKWVASASDQAEKNFRSVVHIILNAISSHHEFQPEMMMKGGILMAITYHSGRFTKDIDFSTQKHYLEFQKGEVVFVENLDTAINVAAEESQYGISCTIQKKELKPGPEGNYQTLHLSVGYALKSNANMMKKLFIKQSPAVVKIDYSFNEKVGDIALINAGGEEHLQTYGKLTLISEKFRALLQQAAVPGGRARGSDRGQDVFDLHSLLTHHPIDDDQQEYLLQLLIDKAKSRDLDVNQASISDPVVADRARGRYLMLIDEIEGDLPNFDEAFSALKIFYESLPWPENKET